MALDTTPLLLAVTIAVIGGFLSFLSPCVLPLVPGYLGYLVGSTLAHDRSPTRRDLLLHTLAFVCGFAIVFTIAGLAIGAFVSGIQASLDYVRWVGGLAVIVIGLHTSGLIRISLLDRQVRVSAEDRLPRGRLVTSFTLGLFFAAGWTPCVGAILAGIFAISATHGPLAGLLFFSYAVGLGIPFLFLALAFNRMTGLLRRFQRHTQIVAVTSGAFLILIGVLLITDNFGRLAALAPPIEPPFLT